MNEEMLRRACKGYKRLEGKAGFYDIAVEIADSNPLQAAIMVLAVWNSARFRLMTSDGQNLIDLQKAIEECAPLFERLKGTQLTAADFDEIKDTVKQIYSGLSKVKGVEYTGASKIVHLLSRDLFVMWDREIREKYGYHKANEDEYLGFLKEMQRKFKSIKWSLSNKTLAKAIDEYNQVTITIPKRQKRKD